MKMHRPIRSDHLLAITCLLLCGAMGLAACGKPVPPMDPPMAPTPVETVPVAKRSLQLRLHMVGTVHSREEIRIIARIAGKVLHMPAAEGSRVQRGDLLLELASPESRARRDRVHSELTRVRVEAAHACDLAQQEDQLLQVGATPALRAQSARETCRAAQAGVQALEASLREQGTMLGHRNEHAPFDGTVLRWLFRPGENVMPGQPVLTLGGPDLEVRIPVTEKDVLSGISPGIPVEMAFPDGTTRSGQVREVSADAVGPARLLQVRVDLPDVPAAIRHGMSVDVRFILQSVEDAWIVPTGSIRKNGHGHHVFVVKHDQLESREVFVKLSSWPESAVNGLFEIGEAVVPDANPALRHGLPVMPVPLEMPATPH